MLLIVLASFLAVLAVYVYKLVKKPTEFWKDQPLKHIPAWPIVGNYANQAFRKKAFVHIVRDMYNYYPNERYVGITIYFAPSLMIRDVDLLKTIAIKDFDYFTDRSGAELESVDSVMGKNLSLLRGQRWKEMRDTLSAAFTSSKMKAMIGLMSECAKQFLDHLRGQGGDLIEVEMKELMCRYTNDVIATCAYGIEVNSYKNKDNEFFTTGVEAMNFTGWKSIKFMMLQSCPKILQYLRMPILSKKESDFFRSVTEETIAHRKKTNLVRPDMIHLLMQAQKGELKAQNDDEQAEETGFASQDSSKPQKDRDTTRKISWKLTNEDISAQVFVFFFAGFDTASTVMSFLAYELAMNVEIQQRLQEEIDEVLANCKNGLPSYEMIVKMKYMDMVVCESLRKWSPATQIDRVCSKDYTIQPVLPHEKPLTIKKGTLIMFPIAAIQYDQKYFPDPYKFDPERFSDENKDNLVPYSYIPFGLGPRFCIGNRFAILEIKVLMFHLLSQFDITFTKKSVLPIILDCNNAMNKVIGGFHVGLKLRRNK